MFDREAGSLEHRLSELHFLAFLDKVLPFEIHRCAPDSTRRSRSSAGFVGFMSQFYHADPRLRSRNRREGRSKAVYIAQLLSEADGFTRESPSPPALQHCR